MSIHFMDPLINVITQHWPYLKVYVGVVDVKKVGNDSKLCLELHVFSYACALC